MGSEGSPTEIKLKSKSRYFYLIFGSIFVGIGVLGIFVPLLPTAIFLIMASACFMKSSPKAAAWLKNNQWLGGYVRNYLDKTGLSITSKIIHIIVLWVSIGLSVYLFSDSIAVRILLFIIAIAVTIHLIMIKTAKS
jgi:uncharacterized membrane protein YbaN (DUF454 family)